MYLAGDWEATCARGLKKEDAGEDATDAARAAGIYFPVRIFVRD